MIGGHKAPMLDVVRARLDAELRKQESALADALESALATERRRQLAACERQLFWFAIGSAAVWVLLAGVIVEWVWQ